MEGVVLIVLSLILGVLAVFLFFIAYRQHKEKGFIFTNTWLYASAKERENMDERIKKAEYRVGRNVFFVTGVLFSLITVNIHFLSWWLYVLIGGIVFFLLIYAIVQYATGERLRTLIEAEKKTSAPYINSKRSRDT